MAQATKKRWDAATIITRAMELGVDLLIVGDQIKACSSDGREVPPRLQQVLQEYRAELLIALTPLCTICLDQGKEQPGPYEWERGMYCETHRPRETWELWYGLKK